ncbi:MAG: ABC transporter permease [Bacillota bacterium]|nr:ABC transporter permease [Bacillota bacterium]
MGKQRLTTFALAVKNLRKRSFRTKSLIVVVAVFSFVMFCGGLLTQSLSLGKNYMSGRMGADIMIVPRGCALSLQNTLLRSESNTFYLNENLAEEISVMPGVEQASPQLYIGSLNAACCTVPVQLIGFDPETDFTIKSWMKNIDSSKLGFGEVVTGSRVNATLGGQVWFFGQPLKVVAKLNDTGMGFDSSVFMTLETAQYMIKASQEAAVHPAGNGKDHISALFVRLSGAEDAAEAAKLIISKYPQTDVVVLKEMMLHISTQLHNIKDLAYGIQGLLWIVSVLVLAVVFTVSANERKREFGLLLALGATRKKLEGLLIAEILIICILGAICGVIAASFIMYEFRMLIAVSLGLPYMQPSIGSAIILAAVSLLLSVFTGVISCLYSVIRIGRAETQIMIREYE